MGFILQIWMPIAVMQICQVGVLEGQFCT